MSRTKFEDDCKGCRPAVLDMKTGQRLPDDHELMKAIDVVWAKTTREERKAFHSVCCLNSRDARDMKLCTGIIDRIGAMSGEKS